MPLGDSITWDSRVGDTRPDGLRVAYRQYLWFMLQSGGFNVDFVGSIVAGQDAQPPFDPDNEGHGGWTAGQIAANVYSWLVLNPADVVLLHIGTNGLTSDPSAIQSILNEVDRFEADYDCDVTVFVARIVNRVPYSATTTQFNDNVASMAQSRIDIQHDKIVLVDIENGAGIDYRIDTEGMNGDMYDYLHPNFMGYQKMANTWYAALHPYLIAAGCPAGVRHHWKLDEASGPAYTDSYGSDTATCVNCPSAVAGRIDGAQQFDGSERLSIIADSAFEWGPTTSFSLECWFNKSGSGSTTQVLLGRRRELGATTWWLGIDADGKLQFHLSDNLGNASLVTPTSVGLNEWHHAAVTRDHSDGFMRVYLDGLLQDSLTRSFASGIPVANDVTIAWFNSSPYYNFVGALDEIAVYDNALLPSQVLGHYQSGLASLGYCDGQAFAPSITTTPSTLIKTNQLFKYEARATGNPKPKFHLASAPTGMTVDSVAGLVEWTPSASGFYSVTLVAANAVASDSQSFLLNVRMPPACPANMTHYWELDEGAGPSYADSYDNNPATCSTCPSAVAGKVAGAQYFDGTRRLAVSDDGSFDWSETDSFTIEFWMKKSTGCSQNEVILGRIMGTMNWWIGIDCPTHSLRFRLQNSTGLIDLYSVNTVCDGLWHHILVTRDGAVQLTSLYVDGTLDQSSSVAFATGFSVSAPMTIGYFDTGGNFGYNGLIDDIALYDQAFSSSAVRASYSIGQAGLGHCFVRGDADNSGGVDISDAVSLLAYIFSGGSAPYPLPAGDANCSGDIDISDVTYLILFIFAGGPEPCGLAD
jgi:lysophospholipase L1-like esterase